MSEEVWAQISGNILAVLVVLRTIIVVIRNWRGGSPELRAIREQMDAQNQHMASLIEVLKDQNTTLRGLGGSS